MLYWEYSGFNFVFCILSSKSANRNPWSVFGDVCGVPEWAVDQKEPHFPCHWLVLCLISLARISPPVVFGFISCFNEDLKSPGSRVEEREQSWTMDWKREARLKRVHEWDTCPSKSTHMRRCETTWQNWYDSLARALRTGGRPWTWRADCWQLTARATARAGNPPTTPQTPYRSVVSWHGWGWLAFCFCKTAMSFRNSGVSLRSPWA